MADRTTERGFGVVSLRRRTHDHADRQSPGVPVALGRKPDA